MGALPTAFCVAACQDPGQDVQSLRKGVHRPGSDWSAKKDGKEDLLILGRPSRLALARRFDAPNAAQRSLPLATAAAAAAAGASAFHHEDTGAHHAPAGAAGPGQLDPFATVESRAMDDAEISPKSTAARPLSPPGTELRQDLVRAVAEKAALSLAPLQEDHPSPASAAGQSATGQPVVSPTGPTAGYAGGQAADGLSPAGRSTSPTSPASPASPTAQPQAPLLPPQAAAEQVDKVAMLQANARQGEFVVVVERPSTGRGAVGLQVVPVMNSQLRVSRVSEGLIAEWNRAHPHYEVKANSTIMEVNGVRGDSTPMLQQIREARTLVLHVKQRARGSIEQ